MVDRKLLDALERDGVDGTPVRKVFVLMDSDYEPLTPLLQTEALVAIWRDDITALCSILDEMDDGELDAFGDTTSLLLRAIISAVKVRQIGFKFSDVVGMLGITDAMNFAGGDDADDATEAGDAVRGD